MLTVNTFPADVACLDAVQGFVRDLMKKAGISREVMGRVELAVEEVFVNIALYAYKERESGGDVTVSCFASSETVSIEFVDSGAPFNPMEREDPDVTLGIAEREAGGLGIFMVKKIMDTTEYHREGEKNILRIDKRISG
jgi:anti-sigma regulatory factor (Ser/Thr protein kinase)